ncbi:hypothetical protein PC116_g29678 [Phytophthora cactorum]|nr:hypothetical protein PC116_g29678 [Phytophthora cactorum]
MALTLFSAGSIFSNGKIDGRQRTFCEVVEALSLSDFSTMYDAPSSRI